MKFDTPAFDFSSGAESDVDPSSAGEVFRDTVASTYLGHTAFSWGNAQARAYDAQISRVYEATGQRLINPMMSLAERRSAFGAPVDDVYGNPNPDAGDVDPHQRFRADLTRLAEQFPDKVDLIRPDFDIAADARRMIGEADQRAASSLARSPLTVNVPLPWLGDVPVNPIALGAGMVDLVTNPAQWPALALWPEGGLGKGALEIALGFAKQGAANAAATAVQQPFIAAWRHAAGLDYHVADGVKETVFSGLAGTVFHGLAKIPEGVRLVRGRGGDPIASLDAAVRDIVDADPAAAAELVKRAGVADEPAVRAALATAERERVLAEPPLGIDRSEHAIRLDDATAAAVDPHALPVGDAVSSRHSAAPPIDEFAVGGRLHALEAQWNEVIDARQNFGPEFRAIDVAVGPTFSIDKARQGIEWALMNGRRDIAEGIVARAEREARLSADRTPGVEAGTPRYDKIAADLVRREKAAADFAAELRGTLEDTRFSAPDARISEVMVRPTLEIAAELRTNPSLHNEGLPWTDAKLRDAVLLSRLDDPAFNAIARGEAAPELGALIANHVADRSRHAGLLDRLQAAGPRTPAEARAALAELLDAPTTRAAHAAIAGTTDEAAAATRNLVRLDDPTGPEAMAQLEALRQARPDDVKPSPELAAELKEPNRATEIADIIEACKG